MSNSRTSSPALSTLFSLDDFRSLMQNVNNACRGIGCGYARLDCRKKNFRQQVATWVGNNPERLRAKFQLVEQLKEYLPRYFRYNSDRDEGIEDEREFRMAYCRIVGIAYERLAA